jgi:hypothetical protein
MIEIKSKIEHDITISEETILRGMIVGNVTVAMGGTFILHGMVTGSLYLKPGSETVIHGTVSGDVINQGGSLLVFGNVLGKVSKVTK